MPEIDTIKHRKSNQDLPAHLDLKEKFEFIELIIDSELQNLFMKEELADFSLSSRPTHPLLSDRALKFIMPFLTFYFCE